MHGEKDNKQRHVTLSLSKKALLIISLPVCAQLILLFQYAGLIQKVEKLAEHEYYSKAVINHVNWTIILLSVATNSLVLSAHSGEKDYRGAAYSCLRGIPESVHATRQEIVPGNTASNSLKTFDDAVEQASALLKKHLSSGSNLTAILQDLCTQESKQLCLRIFEARRNLLQIYRLSEKSNPQDLPKARMFQKILLLVIMIADIAFVYVLINSFNVQIAKKLAHLADNSIRQREGKALLPPLQGNDEITLLDAVFHETAAELMESRKQLEESEKRMQQVIRNMPVGLVTAREDGTIESVNTEIAKLFEIEEVSSAGQPFSSIIPEISSAFVNQSDEVKQLKAVRSDGKPLILEVSRRDHPTQRGNLSLVAVRDITLQKELEQVKQDFLNMVSHDLRSPLTSVQLFQSILAKGYYGPLSDAGRQNLERSQRNIDRLLKMISDLLDFERMESGQVSVNLKSEALNDILKEAIDSVTGFAETHKVTLSFVPDNDFRVFVDRDRLMQVFVNLISNAIKFSPRGSVVTIETAKNADSIEVRVIDRGRGVPPEFTEVIFEKYKQVEKSDSESRKGVGLGLPICKWIIDAHGGTIGLISEVGSGSTFWVRLPTSSAEPL